MKNNIISHIEPQFLKDARNPSKILGVLLKYEDFETLIEKLEELQDLVIVYQRKTKSSQTIPFEKIKKRLLK